jgi:hypothetical protein
MNIWTFMFGISLELGAWDLELSAAGRSRVLEDLLDRRVTGENAAETVLPQGHHSQLNRFFL